MTKSIRFGVAAAAALTFLPAWGSDASFENRREVQRESEQWPAQTASPLTLHLDSFSQGQEPEQRAREGSGAGEPAKVQDQDKRLEQQKAAREQFLNEVWSKP